MRRRSLLLAAGGASASLAGCLGPNMPRDAVVRAVEQSATGGAVVVAYADLPQGEQQIARTAVEENFYHACPELPESLRSFSSRFEGVNDAYLEYQGTTYGVWIRIEDTTRADTAEPPENEPSCGLI